MDIAARTGRHRTQEIARGDGIGISAADTSGPRFGDPAGTIGFRRKYIGFVFQQYNLVPILNIYENIVLPLRLDGAKIDDELLEEIVKFLGIKEKLGNLPKELSGGQQQRVAIARALLAKPALLLADEPTGSLDSATSREVMKLLRTCGERYHQTIVVVTHQQEVAQMADRIIHLLDGKIYKEERIHTREGEGGIA